MYVQKMGNEVLFVVFFFTDLNNEKVVIFFLTWIHLHVINSVDISSNYFSRCWREYLQDGEEFDIAIWEFNINDAKENNLKKTLEIFTRSFYKRFMRIDLLFAVFYRSLISLKSYIGIYKKIKKYIFCICMHEKFRTFYTNICI